MSIAEAHNYYPLEMYTPEGMSELVVAVYRRIANSVNSNLSSVYAVNSEQGQSAQIAIANSRNDALPTGYFACIQKAMLSGMDVGPSRQHLFLRYNYEQRAPADFMLIDVAAYVLGMPFENMYIGVGDTSFHQEHLALHYKKYYKDVLKMDITNHDLAIVLI